jgi:thiol-disulfide isomerase/thioredoxin
MSKKTLIILFSIIAIALFAFYNAAGHKGNAGDTSTSTEPSQALKQVLKKYIGKPSLIFIVSTSCPHCQEGVPKYKTELYDVYKEKINIFLNIVDWNNGGRFSVKDIPQGLEPILNFKTLTGEDCGYVPSWILLNKEGVTVDKACGASKELDDLKQKLDNLLSS